MQTLNLNGSGELGSGALLSFGDNGTVTNNLLIGEYGTGDSDQLLLHGKKGLYFSTSPSVDSKMFLSQAGNLGIGTTTPLSKLSVNTDGDADRIMYVYNSGTERMARFQLEQASGNFGIALCAIVKNSSSTGSKHVAGNFQCYEAYENNKMTFGIRAHAGRGYDGGNFAVYGGLVGNRDGGAIVGTISDEPDIDGIYAGYFYGDVHITGDLTVDGDYPGWSDSDIKRDIRFLDNDVLDKLATLQTIKYKIKVPEKSLNDTATIREVDPRLMKIYERDRIGLIAQELQMVYPELVTEGNDGHLRIKYLQVIPLLVKAINSQQEQIKTIESILESSSLKKGGLLELSNDSGVGDHSTLYQNSPNPFNDETIIKYYIENSSMNAFIYVYDLRGKQLAKFIINKAGEGEIIIPSSRFEPGIYIYNLFVDGIIIDSKQMILTD